jgi:hypothetical protein
MGRKPEPTPPGTRFFAFTLNPGKDKSLKTSTPSNWRPLLRALYLFLIVSAALCAMPRKARAQLYVIQFDVQNGIVSKYNATTGKLINADFIAGLDSPIFLGLFGNSLFEASFGGSTLAKYNATTGAPINVSFISGLSSPTAVAFTDATFLSPQSFLFVANLGGTIGKYDAKTGATVNASFITGLIEQPVALAVLGTTSFFEPSSSLFVVTLVNGTVGKYNATTGEQIKAKFITGLHHPSALAVLGNTLLIADEVLGTVSEYDATTGKRIKANFITGLTLPTALALLGNKLFVTNGGSPGAVGEYDAKTGATINANLITGLVFPEGLAVKAAK